MRVHPNAKTTPRSRAVIIDRVENEGWSVAETAAAFGVSERTVYKWRSRYRAGGFAALQDGQPTPRRIPHRTPEAKVARIVRLRRQRLRMWEIAWRVGVPRSTVAAVLARHGLSRLPLTEQPPPVVRYQRDRAGELLHIDTKPLGKIAQVGHRIHGDRSKRVRGIGYEHAHVAIDDASRLAYVEILPTAQRAEAVGFLERAVSWFASHGIRIEQVMSDNGSAYLSRAFAATCQMLNLRHIRTRPYTPRTNGKAERFIQTMLREWAYRRPYRTSGFRRRALRPWLRYYNRWRPHMGLNFQSPLSRLRELSA
jgi:transposase InsO family protein